MSRILVVAEHRRGKLRECTLESLGAALALAGDQRKEVLTLLLADDPRPLAEPLIGRSPALRLIFHAELKHYNPELYLPVLEEQVAELNPRLVLMGHTSQGMDLAPALAQRLGVPMVSDCTGLTLADGSLVARRSVYGGKVIETLDLRSSGAVVVTLQGGAFSPPEAGSVETSMEEVPLTDLAPRHARRSIEVLDAVIEDVDIAAAEILVSVGRGIGSKENVALAQELADVLGATLSCSRPVADEGWLLKSRQVGTSGKSVRPRVYLALGISGAFQHIAGMLGSETIIAVNKDPRAPIFQIAHYGIVDDLFKVLPVLIDKLRDLRNQGG